MAARNGELNHFNQWTGPEQVPVLIHVQRDRIRHMNLMIDTYADELPNELTALLRAVQKNLPKEVKGGTNV